jgi:hypothetical protein
MKYLYVILTFLLTSCFTRRPFSYDPSYQTTTVVTAYTPPRPFGWWFRPSYFWQPRPYNPYYYTPTYVPPRTFYVPPRSSYVPPRPRTNLPLNTGPRGGRRK